MEAAHGGAGPNDCPPPPPPPPPPSLVTAHSPPLALHATCRPCHSHSHRAMTPPLLLAALLAAAVAGAAAQPGEFCADAAAPGAGEAGGWELLEEVRPARACRAQFGLPAMWPSGRTGHAALPACRARPHLPPAHAPCSSTAAAWPACRRKHGTPRCRPLTRSITIMLRRGAPPGCPAATRSGWQRWRAASRSGLGACLPAGRPALPPCAFHRQAVQACPQLPLPPAPPTALPLHLLPRSCRRRAKLATSCAPTSPV